MTKIIEINTGMFNKRARYVNKRKPIKSIKAPVHCVIHSL